MDDAPDHAALNGSATTDPTVLVTGGFGFIGSAVVRSLSAGGARVRVLDNGWRAKRPEFGLDAVEMREGDIRDARTVRAACKGVDTVVHLAAIQGTDNFYRIPDTVLEVNVEGTLNVARSCAEEGVRRLVFSSSSEAYGSPALIPTPEDSPLVIPDVLNARYSYAGSKIIGELIAINFARRHNFEYTVIRYHNVYGPGMGWSHVIPQFISRLVKGEEFVVQGDGTQTRAFCYIDDAVRATVLAATRGEAGNQILNIGNAEREWSIAEVISLLADVSGVPITPRFVPGPPGGPQRRVPDLARIHALGYTPQVPLPEGLARTYAWYRQAIRADGAVA